MADVENYRIQKFDSDGTYITQWGSSGTGNSQFNWITGITADSEDNIYVTDDNNDRIQKFDSDDTYITQWALDLSYAHLVGGIAHDSNDNIYVGLNDDWDYEDFKIVKFTSNGSELSEITGSFGWIGGLAFDSSNNLYVNDADNDRVQKLDPEGNFLAQWGSSGSGNGQFGANYVR